MPGKSALADASLELDRTGPREPPPRDARARRTGRDDADRSHPIDVVLCAVATGAPATRHVAL